MKKIRQSYYLNELITIISETKTTYTIEYEDGYIETIPNTALEYIFSPIKQRSIKKGIRLPKKQKKCLKSNPKRKLKNFKKHFHSKERVLWIKSLPCLVCGRTPSDNAHIQSRGSGGTCKDIVPLCNKHHKDLDENLGRVKFETVYGLNLALEADKVSKMFVYS